MYLKPIIATAIILGAATGAHAAPVDVNSVLNLSHEWTINSGNAPAGIDIRSLAATFEIDRNAASSFDSPTAVQNEDIHVQVGNPFFNPPLPAEGSWDDVTVDLATADFARGYYSTSVTVEDDGDAVSFDAIRRDVTQEGLATVAIASGAVAASASSREITSRTFEFENTTDNLISFNLNGMFEAELEASVSGPGGIAQATGGFGLIFETEAGSSITHFMIAPYLTTTDDSAAGATVTEQLLLNSGGILGVDFDASVMAIGDSGAATASFLGDTRYIFGISIAPGETVSMSTSHYQMNSVEYTPGGTGVPPVPLPASALLLIGGLLTLTRLKKRAV